MATAMTWAEYVDSLPDKLPEDQLEQVVSRPFPVPENLEPEEKNRTALEG